MNDYGYNPKSPDAFNQLELPPPPPLELNISQVNDAFSTLKSGAFQSKNYRSRRSGFKISEDGRIEALEGYFSGTFNLGGTLITIDDINDLQDTIDILSSLGGGTVSLVPNSYTASASFPIPSNVAIDGNSSTINFGGGAYQFLIQGSGAYSTGTISATFGSPNIVGVGTAWTSAMVGQSILLGDFWYTILSWTDNTHITLAENFMGTTLAGDTYVIATTVDNVIIKNITLTNSSTTPLSFRYVNAMNMSALGTTSAPQGVSGQDSAGILYGENSFVDSCTAGLIYNNVPFAVLNNFGITNITGGTALDLTRVTNTSLGIFSLQAVTGVGLKFTNCSNLGFINYSIIEVTSHGVEFASNNNDIDSLSGYINTCGGDGVKMTATSDRNTIASTSLLNCTGYGINIAASTCDNNIIDPSCSFNNNTSGNINDSGTLTRINGVNIQIFTTSGTWTKPAGVQTVEIVVIGAGGGGGSGGSRNAAGGTSSGGSGGGGGSVKRIVVQASSLNSTETITIGAGGTGGAGVTNNNGNNGVDGGDSSFGGWLTAYGGKKGIQGLIAAGGISTLSAGNGGGYVVATADGIAEQGASTGAANAVGFNGEYGGGSGGGSGNGGGKAGGSSIYGGGGGGGGDGTGGGGAGDGGASGSYTVGGGATGGASGVSNTVNKKGYAGTGGSGAISNLSVGGSGGTGCGGGGSKGVPNGTSSQNGGAGGNGEVRVFSR